MARRQTHSRILPQQRPHRKVTREEKLAFISQYGRVSDPTNTRSVNRRYQQLKAFPLHLQKKATKEQRAALKKRGFFVTPKGVIVDGPRDIYRKPISTRRFAVVGDGIVKWTVNGRRDFIIGFTPQDKREFARDPKGFVRAKLKELKRDYPDVRNARDIQVRLQWGAYQATKDFTPYSFTKRYPYIESKRKGQKILDRLTGLHIVVHVPVKHRKRKHGKKKS